MPIAGIGFLDAPDHIEQVCILRRTSARFHFLSLFSNLDEASPKYLLPSLTPSHQSVRPNTEHTGDARIPAMNHTQHQFMQTTPLRPNLFQTNLPRRHCTLASGSCSHLGVPHPGNFNLKPFILAPAYKRCVPNSPVPSRQMPQRHDISTEKRGAQRPKQTHIASCLCRPRPILGPGAEALRENI